MARPVQTPGSGQTEVTPPSDTGGLDNPIMTEGFSPVMLQCTRHETRGQTDGSIGTGMTAILSFATVVSYCKDSSTKVKNNCISCERNTVICILPFVVFECYTKL